MEKNMPGLTSGGHDWMSRPIAVRADGSYVIERNGLPYHVPNLGEWTDLWAEVHTWAQAHPEAVTEERPWAPCLADVKAARLADIDAACEAALVATLTMPAASPSAADVATEAALFAVEDAAGLASVKALLAARREELRARVEAAATVAEVAGIVVSFPV